MQTLVPMKVEPYGYWRVTELVRDKWLGGPPFYYTQTYIGYPESEIAGLFEQHLKENGLVVVKDV